MEGRSSSTSPIALRPLLYVEAYACAHEGSQTPFLPHEAGGLRRSSRSMRYQERFLKVTSVAVLGEGPQVLE